MAEPTPLQTYYLVILMLMRWFGLFYAGMAVVITGSNLPWLMRSNDIGLLALHVGGGAAFVLIGLGMFRLLGAVERRYRARIANRGG